MPSGLLEWIPEELCGKSCCEIFTKYKPCGRDWIFKIVRMYLLTGVLKTHSLLFQKIFKPGQGNKWEYWKH